MRTLIVEDGTIRWDLLAQERAKKRKPAKCEKLSPEARDEMRAAQHYRCAICLRPESEIKQVYSRSYGSSGRRPMPKLLVDHCHRTGKVRGLLCQPCNLMLGKQYDNVAALRSMGRHRAADYVEGVLPDAVAQAGELTG